ncbi:MAG: ParB/Srx family N-terminal domain-containing protein [Sedimenticola sp.]
MRSSSKQQQLTLSETKLIPFEKINLEENSFQLRNPHADGVRAAQSRQASRNHVDNLNAVLKEGKQLDPIVIWIDPEGRYVVVDGHHRYKAYRRYWKSSYNGMCMYVPVQLLPEGTTYIQAQRYAFLANGKDKLPMSRTEKTQAAWKLIWNHQKYADLGDRPLADAMGRFISKETARKMKKARKNLKADGYTEAPLWRDVTKMNWNKDDEGLDQENWRETAVEKLSVELEAVIKAYGKGDPMIMLEAFSNSMETLGHHGLNATYDRDADQEVDLEEDEEMAFY